MKEGAAAVVEGLVEGLVSRGLDIAQPLRLDWYNSSLPEGLGARITARGAARGAATTLLVGNSRSLWDHFLDACKRDEGLLASGNPLDRYVETSLVAALAATCPGLRPRVLWSNQRTSELEGGEPGFVAVQRMAHAAGLAYLDQESHLCLHPRLGPWFALRAVVLFDDLPWPAAPRPAELPSPLCPTTQLYVRLAVQSAVHGAAHSGSREGSPPPAGIGGKPSMAAVRAGWKRWVAVRDAPFPGHPWRYCKRQIEYHYTGNVAVLLDALRRRREGSAAMRELAPGTGAPRVALSWRAVAVA